MLKQIMKRAHELAREMEGHYAARLSLALRQAWEEAKAKPKNAIMYVRHQPSGGKEWVAEIVGRHPKFKFDRLFEQPVERRWSGSGKTGSTLFELEEGKIYEVNAPYEGRQFVTVVNGQIETIGAKDVLEKIS